MKRAQLHHNLLADQPFLCRSPKVSDIALYDDSIHCGNGFTENTWESECPLELAGHANNC